MTIRFLGGKAHRAAKDAVAQHSDMAQQVVRCLSYSAVNVQSTTGSQEAQLPLDLEPNVVQLSSAKR